MDEILQHPEQVRFISFEVPLRFLGLLDSKNADEKLEDSTTLSADTPRPASSELLFLITSFIAKSVIPNLRRFLLENDKVIAACNNIVYYIINPAMRGKTR